MAAIRPGAKAPEFKLKGAAGEQVAVPAAGRPSVLLFMKSGCPYCQNAAPKIAPVLARHKGGAVAITGVTSGNDSDKDIGAFAGQTGMDFSWAMDPGRKVRSSYGATIVPTLVFVGADGKVVRVYEGATDRLADAVDATIAALAGAGELPDYAEVGGG